MSFTRLIFIYALLLLFDGIFFQIISPVRDSIILQPAFFGGIILLMAIITLKTDLQAFGKHGAAALSVIAFASSVTYLYDLTGDFSGNTAFQNLSNSVMACLSLLFLIFAVRQFARERKDES